MKTLYLFLLTFLSMQNCSNRMQDKFPIKIIDIYHQYWIAGVRGGGSGRSLYITLEKKLPGDLEITQLYFRNGLSNPTKISDTQYLFSFQGTANLERENPIEIESSKKPTAIESPIKIEDNEAILEYIQKGEKKYYKLTNIKEKEMLAYPSARPQGNDKN